MKQALTTIYEFGMFFGAILGIFLTTALGFAVVVGAIMGIGS